MDRSLPKVIEEMLAVIPDYERDLKFQLKDNQSSASFSAPEMLYIWWNETHRTLWEHIPEKPNQEWQFKVLSIFSTKSVEELKEVLA